MTLQLPTAKAYGVTPADFPEQDWSIWEAMRYSRPPDGKIIDTKFEKIWPCCIHCATWICAGCWNWRRSRADRTVTQNCRACGSQEGFFVAVRHGTRSPHGPHVPRLPFVVPRMMPVNQFAKAFEEAFPATYKGPGRPVDASLLACPAGNPCPATGCPACCPEYDPCGQESCSNCNPRREMPDVNQAACGYGCDDEIASGNCPVHGGGATPIQQEADEVLTAQEAFDLSEDEARERGFLPPRQKAEAGVGGEIAPHVVKMVLDKIRDAYAAGNGPENILAFEIRYLQELCDLAMQYPHPDGDNIVLGPEVFVNPTAGVICWKGENYYKRKVTDEDRKLIAQNAKASIERRDRERAQKLLREMALHHAVEIHKAGVNTSPEVTVTADSILSWLAKSE